MRGLQSLATFWNNAWDDVAAKFYDIEQKQFASEGGRSHRWARLTPAYEQWKAKNYPGKKILEREGTLRESLVGPGNYAFRQDEKLKLRIGTTVPYAIYHQKGTSKMVKRRPIDVQEADVKELQTIMLRHLVNKLRAAGVKVGKVNP